MLQRFLAIAIVTVLAAACKRDHGAVMTLPPAAPPAEADKDLPPVALNAETPVQYPPVLFDQGIEGTVILRLYADSTGALVADSTRVQESSGYPALDSAALAAAPSLTFAPARRDGQPVAAAFLQPIYFRHPGAGGVTP